MFIVFFALFRMQARGKGKFSWRMTNQEGSDRASERRSE
jgi:hypothetical protein